MYPFSPNVDRNANYISCKSDGDVLNRSSLTERVRPERIAARRQYKLLCMMTMPEIQWLVVHDKEMDEGIETTSEIVKADDWNTRFRISSWTKY